MRARRRSSRGAAPEDGYYFNDDLSSHAIKWMRQQKALMPDRPFFAYYAPGATHAPHHVPKEWADKYAGVFDDGWDALREKTFARQKELGVIPPDAELTVRSAGIPAWDDVADEMKPVLARQMEVYAGYMENTDHHIGQLLDALEDMKILDDTLIITIIGDNGASAEGSLQGTFNEMITLGGFGALESAEFLSERIEKFGGPEAYNHYAVGWAHAMDTPYQWTKQVASHFGGTRNGTIVHWPHGIKASGEIRTQFHHVIDVAPTVLEAAGLPHPTFVNGVQQKPIEGVSMAYSFDAADAPERHETQYFEMFGNRGIYHKGWTAVTKHRTPWETGADFKTPAFDDDVWELYDTTHRLDAGARSRQGASEEAARAAAPVADRGGQIQRRPARRPLRRARPARHGRAPDAREGQAPAALRRHGPPDREQRADHQEHLVLAHRPADRARRQGRGRDHGPGRHLRRP